MNVLIFSKDRACQLYALLESIEMFDTDNVIKPDVLYTSSTQDFGRGYCSVRERFSPKVRFHEQTTFKFDVMAWLNRVQGYSCMFLVDDQFMRHPLMVSQYEIDGLLSQNGNIGTVSLRLGKNTTHQYQTNQDVALPKFGRNGNFLTWNSYTYPSSVNWGYPLSVDGHVFRTTDLRALCRRLVFSAPNTLEEQLSLQKGYFSCIMACLEESVFVNNPLNLVQSTHNNKFNNYATAEELNNAYLSGMRIDISTMIAETEIVVLRLPLEGGKASI